MTPSPDDEARALCAKVLQLCGYWVASPDVNSADHISDDAAKAVLDFAAAVRKAERELAAAALLFHADACVDEAHPGLCRSSSLRHAAAKLPALIQEARARGER